jgi:phosphatidate cytidylyltransferase
MIRQRIATAVVLAAGLLLVLFALPLWLSALLLGLLLAIGAWEWSALARLQRTGTRAGFVFLTVLAGLAAAAAGEKALGWLLLADVSAWLLGLFWMLRYPVPVPPWFSLACGLVVLSIGWALIVHLLGDWGALWALFVFGIVAAADVGAFFAGRRFGRRKLAPTVSPGKTWEGVVGGLLLVSIVASGGAQILGVPIRAAVLAAIAVAAFSILGDLTVSMLKRSAGLKDSGQIFPGHGGVLDRIDSLLAALPLYVLLFGWVAGR